MNSSQRRNRLRQDARGRFVRNILLGRGIFPHESQPLTAAKFGVVPDGKCNSLGEAPKTALYRPFLRSPNGAGTLVVRTRGNPQATLTALRTEVQKLDPSLPLFGLKTLKEHMGTSLFPARMAAIALGSFGLMSYVVAGRTREIGLRMAIGAQRADVRQLRAGSQRGVRRA